MSQKNQFSGISTEQRFFEKVNKTSVGCWIWIGATVPCRDGFVYGKFWLGGRMKMAHRASWELFRGDIPVGLTIDHLCRVTLCVNPEHLEPVTQKENTMRGNSVIVTNSKKTHCPAGHEYSENNLELAVFKSKGHRQCRICGNARRKQARLSRALLAPAVGPDESREKL